MDAIEAITRRVSTPALGGAGISAEQIQLMVSGALRAADHAWLRPTRFINVSGDQALRQLGEVFAQGVEEQDAAALERLRSLPLRAPTILVAVCNIVEHPKVSADEQLLSSGAAVQNLLNVAWALGIGAIWRTGPVASCRFVADALGLMPSERIVGFIYLGQAQGNLKQPPAINPADFVTDWKIRKKC